MFESYDKTLLIISMGLMNAAVLMYLFSVLFPKKTTPANLARPHIVNSSRPRFKKIISFFSKLQNQIQNRLATNRTASFLAKNDLELKKRILEKDQTIKSLFSDIEGHLKNQIELVNENMDLKFTIDSMRQEIKGLSHLWENTSKENQFILEKNKRLLEYSTSLAHSFRRSLNINTIQIEASQSDKDLISEVIAKSINKNEPAQKFIENEINESFSSL